MIEIRYSPRALEDIENIWAYIADVLDAPLAAVGVVSAIRESIDSLARFPGLGASVKALSGRETSLRYLVCKKRVIVYRQQETTVYILRVFSGGENWIAALFPGHLTDE